MFIEPGITKDKRGWIEIICGSMFSGKTEELIRRLKRAKFANLKVEIFKPAIDLRYDELKVVSHDANAIPSTPVENAQQVSLLAQGFEVIGIDEAQFFDDAIVAVCNTLALQGARVIVAGLDMDFQGNPFGPMPQLLAVADFITKLHAICMRCGNIASFSHRKTQQQAQVVIGEQDIYEPLCRKCFNEVA